MGNTDFSLVDILIVPCVSPFVTHDILCNIHLEDWIDKVGVALSRIPFWLALTEKPEYQSSVEKFASSL